MNLSFLHIRLVVRGCLLEIWRRQDVWILCMLMGVFAVLALGARFTGDVTPATGTFMLNLGMNLAVLFSQGLTALLSVRQFPNEIENRTLYPLLAKPLSRDSLLVGKWLACLLGGVMTFLVFHLLTLLVSPPAEPYASVLHLQHMLLQVLSLCWVSAMGITLSLYLPRALALGSTLLLVFGAENLYRLLHERIPMISGLLPRFGALNLSTRLTDGIVPLDLSIYLFMVLYAGLWTLLCLSAARAGFIRRAL